MPVQINYFSQDIIGGGGYGHYPTGWKTQTCLVTAPCHRCQPTTEDLLVLIMLGMKRYRPVINNDDTYVRWYGFKLKSEDLGYVDSFHHASWQKEITGLLHQLEKSKSA